MKTRFLIALFAAASLGAITSVASAPLATLAVAPAADAATPAAVPLTRDHLLSSLSRDLAGHFNLEGDLEVELIRAWTPPSTVAANWTVSITEYPMLPSSSMMIRCRVIADTTIVAEPTFVVRAALWRDVWVARAPLTYGATFDASMLETRRVDTMRERDALPAAVGDRSYIFARAVSAGGLLTWRDIARRPLVKKGEMVDVTASEGMLVLSMKGLAMENGSQGDTVTVRNPDSRKDFVATVVDENRVQVRF